MQFILYSDVGEGSIRDKLGRPEYSYFFVLSGFRAALSELGSVVLVQHPEIEVDAIYDDCVARGEDCVFLSFTPPHKTLIDLRCPTVVVLAWEFDTIPTGGWDDEKRNDWRLVFARLGRAICLSSYSARAVKAAMGENFPVVAIAAPVPAPEAACLPAPPDGVELRLRGTIVDSPQWGFRCDLLLPPERPFQIAPEDEEEVEPPELLDTDEVPFHAAVSDLLAPAAIDSDPFQPPAELLLAPASDLLAPSAIDAKPVPLPAPPPPKRLRYRLGITKRYLVEWYREVVRDMLPPSVGRLMSRLGRLGERLYRSALGETPPAAPESLAPAPAPAPILELPPETAAISSAFDLVACAPPDPAPAEPEPPPEARVQVSGVVYTAFFNPTDGRKNWMDLLTAFVYTFREVEDVTLVMKMIHYDPKSYYDRLFVALSQLAPFKCRVISLYGYLETAEYQNLIAVTDYYVSAAKAEGLCLPLMEFMACGKPAVTPLHTAMEDYVDPDAAFIVRASAEHNVWPHDPRALYTTAYYRVDWESLCDRFRESYSVAKGSPERYAAMAEHAAKRVRAFGSVEAVREQLRDFFELPVPAEHFEMAPAAS